MEQLRQAIRARLFSRTEEACPQWLNEVGLSKQATCRRVRHCFITNLLENGYAIRTVREILGSKEGNAAIIYPPVPVRGDKGV